jgi:hypothetical protein
MRQRAASRRSGLGTQRFIRALKISAMRLRNRDALRFNNRMEKN